MNPEDLHPDPLTIEAFALGRLSTRRMRGLEAHLVDCPTCARTLMAIPDDHLIKLLRHPPETARPGESCR